MKTVTAALLGLAVAACGKPRQRGYGVHDQGLVTCSSIADCKSRDEQRVKVVGIYQKHNFGKGPKPPWQGHGQLELGDGAVMLGRYWHEESKRDLDEVERFEGKKVAAVGRFLAETPPRPGDPPYAARLLIAALVDIESLALVEP